MTEVISIGLDGAAWHKVDRLIDEGVLPNWQTLVESGAKAPLRTVNPPVTCPAWRCSTSGKNPGKVGVYWWLNMDRETGAMTTPNAVSFDTADVWDYLSKEEHRCAVINVPMTYPPSPLNGVMISGFGAPFELTVEETMTYPHGLQDEIEKEYDWQIGVDDLSTAEGVEAALNVIESRFELLLDMLDEDYDYIHLTVFYLNMLQHQYGDGKETRRAYELIDKYLGQLPDDITTVMYSDHGHSHIAHTFVVNKYLIDNGYLVMNTKAGDNLTGTLYQLLKRTGISPKKAVSAANRVLPSSLIERIVESGYPVPTFKLAERIDWKASRAVALSQGPVYLNRKLLGNDYEAFRDQLQSELIEVSFDGNQPIKDVYTAEEIYDGPYVDEAPDLMLIPNEQWEVYGGITPSVVEEQPTAWTSGNHPLGILQINGPDIKPIELGEQSILDIMPTVLRYMDCAVPEDIDGQAITEPFQDGLSDTGSCEPLEPPLRSEAGESRELKQRLEDLGYLQ